LKIQAHPVKRAHRALVVRHLSFHNAFRGASQLFVFTAMAGEYEGYFGTGVRLIE
jgi:hypothetical protein